MEYQMNKRRLALTHTDEDVLLPSFFAGRALRRKKEDRNVAQICTGKDPARRIQFLLSLLTVAALLFAGSGYAQNWIWMKGSNTVDQPGVYGAQGVEDPANTPGARGDAVSWPDGAGNFWLFGGWCMQPANSIFSDLWKFDPASGNWTWVKGSNTSNQPGIYGTQGVADPANNPGARRGAASWTDAAGNLWVFGGWGYAASGIPDWLNDLWKFDPVSSNWTWMKGSNAAGAHGIYGTQGVADPAGSPGGRQYAAFWTDNAGNLWLYGGEGYTASYWGDLNDLWKYDVNSDNWTWVKGSSTHNQPGIYGARGVEDSANAPGGRRGAAGWSGNAGDLWLFGGHGYAVSGWNFLNDLWRYDTASGNWTWMKGGNVIDQPGVYGAQGVADPANAPGAREGVVSWTDSVGNLWLFGGDGYGASGGSTGTVSDIWKYDVSSGNWTWMKGGNAIGQHGVYGTQGVADPANAPGSRLGAVSWTDSAGNLWMFGGLGYAATSGFLNDLWRLDSSLGPNPTPTPGPTPSLTPTPSPTATCTPAPTSTPTPIPGPTPRPTAVPGSGADLAGNWTQLPRLVCTQRVCKLKAKFGVQNTSPDQKAPQTVTGFYLSDDQQLDDTDTHLKSVSYPALRHGRGKTKQLNIVVDETASGKYLIALIDAQDAIAETDESNNAIAAGPIP